QRKRGRCEEGLQGQLDSGAVAQLRPELQDHAGRGWPLERKVTRGVGMDRDQLRSLLEQVLPAVWRVRLYLVYALAGVALARSVPGSWRPVSCRRCGFWLPGRCTSISARRSAWWPPLTCWTRTARPSRS